MPYRVGCIRSDWEAAAAAAGGGASFRLQRPGRLNPRPKYLRDQLNGSKFFTAQEDEACRAAVLTSGGLEAYLACWDCSYQGSNPF
jgi:hypothetical protein